MRKYSRVWLKVWMLRLLAALCVCLIFIPRITEAESSLSRWLFVILGLLQKVVLEILHYTVIMYCLEGCPTQLRAFSIGLLFLLQNLTYGVLGQFRTYDQGVHIKKFMALSVALAIWTSFRVRKLKETFGQELKEQIIEQGAAGN